MTRDRRGARAAAALGEATPAEADEALAALVDHRVLIPDAAGRFRFRGLARGYAMARAAR
jgi:hypothetical protein